ncbi:MAG: VRR-NUC domain-containing protein [Pseudomonadales bacterium]
MPESVSIEPFGSVAADPRSGVSLSPGQAPPPGYYANNLRQLAQFVAERYGAALDASSGAFVEALLELPEPALRLYARLAGRKGTLFRLDSLRYSEVADIDLALGALAHAGLVERQHSEPADRLLALVKVPELQSWFASSFAGRSRWRKQERIARLLSDHTDQRLRQQLGRRMQWLTVTSASALQRLQLLYFGGRHQDLSAFVTEDLGLIRYPQYEQSMPDWWDGSAAALARHEQLHRCVSRSHGFSPDVDQSAYAQELAQQLQSLPVSREQAQVRDRALLRLGHYFERRSQPTAALNTYAPVQRHPARERRVRLLAKTGQQGAADTLLENIRRAPLCAAEADFSERFGKRLPARHAMTELSLIEATPPQIEHFAAQLLLHSGGSAWHVENRLPLGIAGLLYWEVLFAPIPGAFTRPFQVAPNDLRWDDFTAVRSAALAQVEARWGGAAGADSEALLQQMRCTIAQHQGIANPLVSWQLFSDAFVKQLHSALGAGVLARLAHFVIRQLGRYHNGFPDLLVLYPNGDFECVEVKGPGDQLQGAQRRWLDQLAEMNIPARVLKLRPRKQ